MRGPSSGRTIPRPAPRRLPSRQVPPGPAPGRRLLLTPLSAASSQLSATSSSSILLAAFPPPPPPSPRLRPEARLRRGRQHARLCSMNPAPCQARKRLQSKAQEHPGSHLGRGQRNQKVAIFLKGNVIFLSPPPPPSFSLSLSGSPSLEPSFLRANNYFFLSRSFHKLQIMLFQNSENIFIPQQSGTGDKTLTSLKWF